MRALHTGDKVKLTGEFLRNTGQVTGEDGLSVWTVTACKCELCNTGRFVATDQNANTGMLATADHLAEADPATLRHLNVGNIYRLGTLDSRNA
jgi:hypothetical protein